MVNFDITAVVNGNLPIHNEQWQLGEAFCLVQGSQGTLFRVGDFVVVRQVTKDGGIIVEPDMAKNSTMATTFDASYFHFAVDVSPERFGEKRKAGDDSSPLRVGGGGGGDWRGGGVGSGMRGRGDGLGDRGERVSNSRFRSGDWPGSMVTPQSDRSVD